MGRTKLAADEHGLHECEKKMCELMLGLIRVFLRESAAKFF